MPRIGTQWGDFLPLDVMSATERNQVAKVVGAFVLVDIIIARIVAKWDDVVDLDTVGKLLSMDLIRHPTAWCLAPEFITL